MTVWARLAIFCVSAAALAGCDPGVHVAWEKDFDQPIDPDCIESALRTVAPDVTRTSWVDPDRETLGFPAGTVVTQFNYSDPNFIGGYQLNVAPLANGKTHYEHEWGKLGTDIPPEEAAKVLPLLNKANAAVARACHLSFTGTSPKQAGG